MTDEIHPRQLEAQEKAAAHAAMRAEHAAMIAHAQGLGVRFVEVDPQTSSMEFSEKPPRAGRLTIAYREDRRNIVMISTAICHPGDKFDKRMGRAVAARNMVAGEYIMLRKPTSFNGSVKRWVQHTFMQYGE